MKKLSINSLLVESKIFCKNTCNFRSPYLFGITDSKAVGTFVEHNLKNHLANKYDIGNTNSASGIDLPFIETDIKVTSIKQPQSSCPYKDSRQKIFGLGYNLLLFVYSKEDDYNTKEGILNITSCKFIEKYRTGDYQTTTGILNILKNNGNVDDIFAFLEDKNIPGDEVTLYNLAQEIKSTPPEIGYLTISNALQWRLQYGRIVDLVDNTVNGIISII